MNNAIPYPFPYFNAFTWGTPTIPDIYWNAYSYEERIKNLCMEYAKLVAFIDALVDTVNAQYVEIEHINDEFPALLKEYVATDPGIAASIKDAVDEYLSNLVSGNDYGVLKEKGFIHEP